MNDQILQAIHQRIDEQHATLCDRLDRLQEALEALHAGLSQRMDAHEAYHRANEHRFGLLRIAERHPLRLAGAAFAAGGALLSAAPESLHRLTLWLGAALRHLIQ